MQQKLEFNNEGLTFREWLDAAGITPNNLTWMQLRTAWKAGTDPTEYKTDN
jgi:hypothetical protein